MGKTLLTQRRGKGKPRFRSPSHRFKGEIKYPPLAISRPVGGQVLEITHDPGRSSPIAKILLEDYSEIQIIAPEGLQIGMWIQIGGGKTGDVGCIRAVGDLAEGTEVYNIEVSPGDGGKLARSSGASASIVAHDRKQGLTQILMPSKKTILVNSRSRATIGRAAGGGRKEKPFVHAGQMFYNRRIKGKLWPVVCGRAKNSLDHPHGGGRHPHVGRPTTVSRDTPPGRKVGHIAARRTGLRKK
ncbi:MAG: 50S ribosomal protein L2 [Candidatus Altiarchaeales archaeon]|nr:50S ribosomal protein L2 [Candidatus Altiarchaeales archaeon]